MSSILDPQNLVLAVVFLVVVVISIYLVLLVLRSRRRSAVEVDDPATAGAMDGAESRKGATALTGLTGLRRAFAAANRRLSDYAPGAEQRYEIPWILLTGPSGSNPTDLLANTGLNLPFGPPEEGALTGSGRCNWWFFSRGIVIDLGSDYVLRGDGRSDERGWKTALRLLQKYRPKRPIDGVVLTLSARELLAARRRGDEGSAQLETRATEVYKRLWQAQRQLGLQFPVYVLVTGCHDLPGFSSFNAAFPDELEGQMLGWSNPYSLETSYEGTWVEEAFDQVGARLTSARSELFAQRSDASDPDEIFVFPGAVHELRDPVRLVLGHLFRPSAYHEPLLLRGIYLTGDEAPETAGEGVRTLFLRELLERKVFPESGLAQPTAATLVAKNRAVRRIQIALVVSALLMSVGLWRAKVKLGRSVETLEPVIEDTGRDLRDIHQVKTRGLEPEPALVERRASRLFEGFTRIDTDGFWSLFIPTSWRGISRFHEDLRHGLIEAYNQIIFSAMYQRLSDRAIDPTGRGDAGITVYIREPKAQRIGEMPEFLVLQAQVSALLELEEKAALYNQLRDTQDLEDLGEVVEYLFARPLPEAFFEKAEIYREALRDVQYRHLDPSDFHEETSTQVLDLAARWSRSAFDQNILSEELKILARELQELSDHRWPASQGPERFHDLVERLDRTEFLLAQPELEWAFHPRFDLGASYREVMSGIDSSGFLRRPERDQRPPIRTLVEASAEDGWARLRRTLAAYDSEYTGSLLEVEDGVAAMQFSTDTLALRAAMRGFLRQGFVTLEETRQFAVVVPTGTRLVWDTHFLDQAVALQESYDRFLENGLVDFPVGLRSTIEDVARAAMTERVSDFIARAQQFKPVPEDVSPLLLEQEIKAEIDSFDHAVKPLNLILGMFERINAWDEYEDLAELTSQHGFELLGLVDGLLAEEGLYQPRGGTFSWWAGHDPLALEAFGVRDGDDLASLLALQRERITQLAREYAQPLVVWLGKSGVSRQPTNRPLYTKWERILAELYDYENQKPGNSIAELEEYVVSDMAAITVADCGNIAAASSRDSGDFFLSSRNRLRRGLDDRCRGLALDLALGEYRRVADFFNQRLAGRYPFAPAAEGGFRVEAAPADLERFFELFDRSSGLLGALENGSLLDDDLRQFVEEMREVRTFFAAFLASEEDDPVPLFDFDAEFRVNQKHEEGGEQIIDWVLEVGDKRITHRDPERRGRWSTGVPIRLSLRWAKDAPTVPVPDPSQPLQIVQDGVVTYELGNRWSLLSFLQSFRSSARDFDSRADLKPHTLKFVIAVEPVVHDEDEVVPEQGEASVFIRLTVMPPDATEPLVLPRFPREAPPFEAAAEAPPVRPEEEG